MDGTTVKLQIAFQWDTAGQEKFKTITSSYYKGAHGVMAIYDVTDEESYSSLVEEANKFASKRSDQVIHRQRDRLEKIDLESDRKVTNEEGMGLAKRFGGKFVETSAKDSRNVLEAFKMMTREMLSRNNKKGTPSTNGGPKQRGN